MTQSNIILEVLNDTKEWMPSWYFVKQDTKWGWLGTSGDRRARELYEDGKIERKHEGKYSYYKIKEEL